MIPVLIDEIIQECGFGSQHSLAIVEREGRGKRGNPPPVSTSGNLIFQHHAGESSIEESTRQASRQKEIQPKSDEKTEEEKGRKKWKARKTVWRPCAASRKLATADGQSIRKWH